MTSTRRGLEETGEVEYAVLQFGGFLRMGSDYYPVPCAALKYDEGQGGRIIDVDKEFLEKAPRCAPSETPRFAPAYRYSLDEPFGVYYYEDIASG